MSTVNWHILFYCRTKSVTQNIKRFLTFIKRLLRAAKRVLGCRMRFSKLRLRTIRLDPPKTLLWNCLEWVSNCASQDLSNSWLGRLRYLSDAVRDRCLCACKKGGAFLLSVGRTVHYASVPLRARPCARERYPPEKKHCCLVTHTRIVVSSQKTQASLFRFCEKASATSCSSNSRKTWSYLRATGESCRRPPPPILIECCSNRCFSRFCDFGLVFTVASRSSFLSTRDSVEVLKCCHGTTLKVASHRIRLRLTNRLLWPTAVFTHAARTPSPTTTAIRLT